MGSVRVSWLAANVDAWIAAAARAPEWALVNIGINDMGAPATSQASYEADLAYVLDAMHTAWPACAVLVSKVWGRGYDAAAVTMGGWIGNVVTPRAAWVAISDDEGVWAKATDNGATMTTDGVHYSAAGNIEKAAQMLTAMGY